MAETTSLHETTAWSFDTKTRNFDNIAHTETFVSNGRGSALLGTNVTSGIKLPNHKAIIRSGGNATTPFTGTKYTAETSWMSTGVEIVDANGSHNNDFGSEAYGYPLYPGVLGLISAPPASVVTSVTNRCIRKFLDKAESIRSSVEAGQDFGEYKETLHGMTNPLSQLRQHVLSYFPKVKKLKGAYKDAKSLTKALADTYLEWTFGWKPLVSDIAQGYVGLQNRSRFAERIPIRVSSKDSYNGTSTQVSVPGGQFYTIMTNSRSKGEYIIVMYGMINTGVDKSGLVSRQQVLQLDLPHFVPTIWDLIPYSFIVDYFVNVGDIIRALSTIDSVFAWGGEDVIQINTNEFSDVFLVPNGLPGSLKFQHQFAYGGHAKFTKRTISRSILSPAGLLPSVQITLPLSSKPWVNMGAILTSRIASLVPLF